MYGQKDSWAKVFILQNWEGINFIRDISEIFLGPMKAKGQQENYFPC